VKLHHTPPTDAEHDREPIGRVQAALLRVWGPADSWDNPLAGTKYDPVHQAERQHASLEHRRERWEERKRHWDERLHGHRADQAAPQPQHPDE